MESKNNNTIQSNSLPNAVKSGAKLAIKMGKKLVNKIKNK